MAKALNHKYFVDGKAEAVRDRIKFDQFKLDPESLTLSEIDKLLSLPQMDTGCLIKTNPNKSGSAFSQMTEHAILAGYMRTDHGIKALVVYTERPNDDGSFDFGFITLDRFKLPKVPKVKVAKRKAVRA